MKISVQWLSQLVDLPELEVLKDKLTVSGFEVEAVQALGEGLEGVIVVEVKSAKPHPNADRLQVVEVSSGPGDLRQIVCGAKNFQVGNRVPLATPGTRLPGGQSIQASAVRSVDSAGMLCSAVELGLAEKSDGLLLLEGDAPLGAPIAVALGLEDTLLELNVTPNRPDGLSHLGVAREVSALTGATLKPPSVQMTETAPAPLVKVKREDAKGCPRYGARVIEGVRVGPSPAWLQALLRACGVRPISNVVDVTNFVLLELGHPLHAFDLDRLAGEQIVVRRAKAGEKLKTLDGKERVLDAQDLVVADETAPQALAGIMGGAGSEVGEKTTRVLLEAAYFEPRSVRRSAKRHALHTEASHRFERGADLFAIPRALDRAASLIQKFGGGEIRQGRIDSVDKLPTGKVVGLRYERLEQLLGIAIPSGDVRRILQSLGFQLDLDSSEQALFSVPSFRVDVANEEDLVEEVARIWGYDKIPLRLPSGSGALLAQDGRAESETRVRDALSGLGFNEAVNYSFVAPEQLQALGETQAPIRLRNPLSVEQSVMRTTILAGLLQNLSRAVRHQADAVRLYEIGRVYLPDPEGAVELRSAAKEPPRLAGVVWGRREGRTWSAHDVAVDFFDAKGAIECVLAALHIEGVRFVPMKGQPLHPRAAAGVLLQGNLQLGRVGELHPEVCRTLDLPRGVFVFELDLEALYTQGQLQRPYQSLPRYPAVLRDLAVVVSAEVAQEEVRSAIQETGGAWVEEAFLFDQYTGAPIPKGQKNLAFALRYRAPDRTLADTEVAQTHERIVKVVNERFGAQVRGA